jgi:hypothetical protein
MLDMHSKKLNICGKWWHLSAWSETTKSMPTISSHFFSVVLSHLFLIKHTQSKLSIKEKEQIPISMMMHLKDQGLHENYKTDHQGNQFPSFERQNMSSGLLV